MLLLAPEDQQFASPGTDLDEILKKTGRLPKVEMLIKPLDGNVDVNLDKFLTYNFSSSILIPVDTFNFTVAMPDDSTPLPRRIRGGDIASLFANGQQICTGIIDTTEVEVDGESGEKGRIQGRDMLSQLEDQDAINFKDGALWGNNYTISQVLRALTENTRISRDFVYNKISRQPYLFATDPGESKLSALMRYLDPLNALIWTNPFGKVVVGKPNMTQLPSGTIICSRKKNFSNVLSIKVTRNATLVPTTVFPIWSGQESVQNRVSREQGLNNADADVTRLRELKHFVPKTIVVSTPQGSSAQDLSEVTRIKVQGGGSNLLQAYAKKMIARENQKALIVEAVVPGHYNENGVPYQIDQVYNIEYDRGDVFEQMYLFEVNYSLTEETGEQTRLVFCRLGTIVADIPTIKPSLGNLTG